MSEHDWRLDVDACAVCGATATDEMDSGGLPCDAEAVRRWRAGKAERRARAHELTAAEMAGYERGRADENRRCTGIVETFLKRVGLR